MVWAGVLSNIFALAAVWCSSGNTPSSAAYLCSICPAKSHLKSNGLPLESLGIHPALVVGTISAVVAAVLRVWYVRLCMKAVIIS